jgi:hypothetical protein
LVATIEIDINGRIHKVTLDYRSGQEKVTFTTDPEIHEAPEYDRVGSEIIRLCQVGQEFEKSGLTKRDLAHIERCLIIKRT